MKSAFRAACAEIAAVADRLDDTSVSTACAMIRDAGHVMLYGCGREALQLRGLAMRLHHLGLSISMQGDMTAPPLGAGDLFIASAGPGQLSTVSALIGTAHIAGAKILFLTGEPDTPVANHADQILHIDAQTMARDQDDSASVILPMGSLYEAAMFVLFEVIVLRLADMLGQTPELMRARHTNME